MVELLVGIALVVVSLALGWQGAARTFYLGAGIVILIVRGISAYHPDPAT